MSDDQIPNPIRAFIARYIRTVGHLEILLFVSEGAERAWTVDELSRHMRTNNSLVQQQLRDLQGLVTLSTSNPATYQFSATDPKIKENIEFIRELYRSRQQAMIHAIYDRPLDTIRSFADAFKIKKD